MFDSFFIYGDLPANIEKGTYIPLLILASYVIASFGSYTGLTLASCIFYSRNTQEKKLLHWAGAFALGGGIWAMHFIGMLAYKMRMSLSYDPWLTTLSMAIAVSVAYGVLHIIHTSTLSVPRLILGAILLGFGICAMHYTGMASMQMQADLRYMPSLFFISVVIAIGASGAALWIVFYLSRNHMKHQIVLRVIGAAIMGAAICGMHYTGIAASVIIPYANCRFDPSQNFDMLALLVATAVTFIMIGTLAVEVYSRRKGVGQTAVWTLPNWLLPFFVLLTLSVLLAFLVYEKSERDYAAALENYQTGRGRDAGATAKQLDSALRHFKYLGYGIAAFLPALGMLFWAMLARNFRLSQTHVIELEIHKTLSLRMDEKERMEKQLQQYITRMEEAQLAMLEAKESALKANAAKSEFLANMSHELRTPLNSILGILRLLLESEIPESQRDLTHTAFQSSVNLLEIVNDILDLSKIEAGEMTLEQIGFDAHYVLESVTQALDHVAAEKRLSIIRHYDKEVFPFLTGDPTRLAQVLTNLIGNAIKYTDKGHIDVHATCRKLDDTHIELQCKITDTGIGIPKDKHESIFEKFSQADSSTTRKYGGTGLGLTITKQLVELMGGKIGVESEVGHGSSFWFTLPCTITDTLHKDKLTRKLKLFCGIISPANARILVAEDHAMNQLFMQKVLERFGIGHIEIVENGLAALKACRENPWDVILMDCHMPHKNGYETTKDIRDLEKTTHMHVPIVAMTANAMLGDKEKCLRYGMDEYMSKPINVDELKEVLSQWICFRNAPEMATTPVVPESQAPFDLLQLRAFTAGNKEAERELIRLFVKQSNKNIATLKEACHGENDKTWSEAAHMLKGGAGGIGADKLQKLCGEAQHFSGTAEERSALFESICAEYNRVKAHLSA